MLLIKNSNIKNSLGNYIDYLLENGIELYNIDWNGEKYTKAYNRDLKKHTENSYKPVYRFQLENINLDKLEENSEKWNDAVEIVGFDEF